jgi:hypothetical protein
MAVEDSVAWASKLDAGDWRSYTPFHVACAGGHYECAKFLLQSGCDTHLVNDLGSTAWELAEQLRRSKILKLRQKFPDKTDDRSAESKDRSRRQSSPGMRSGGTAAKRGKSRSRRTTLAAISSKASDVENPDGSLTMKEEPKDGGLVESRAMKQELKALGLSTKGSKAELKQRLSEARVSIRGNKERKRSSGNKAKKNKKERK